MHQERQALAVDFGGLADSLPAALDELSVSLGVTGRANHGTIFDARAVFVAGVVER